MKELYIITLEIGLEESVYFTEMTERGAEEIRDLCKRYEIPGTVEPVRKSPGFNKRAELVRLIHDIGNT